MTGSRWTMSQTCFVTSLLSVVSGASLGGETVAYHVPEELPVGSVIGNIVVDFDLQRRYNATTMSTMTFDLLVQPAGEYLRLDAGSWNVVIAGRIDREALCTVQRRCVLSYTIAVQPRPVFQLLNIEVEVLDTNDNWPTFSEALPVRHISESAEIGSQLTLATVCDLDLGVNGLDRYETTTDCSSFDAGPTTRQLAGGNVEIRLRLDRELDREALARCVLVVWAMDGGSPAKTGSTRIEIIIVDANDNPPMFDADSYEVWLPENLAVGTCFIAMSASDADQGLNAEVTYTLDTESWDSILHQPASHLPFIINTDFGTICLEQELDFEIQSMFLLSVVAEDKGVESLSGHTTLAVYVDDVNDNAPSIAFEVISGSSVDIEVPENHDEHELVVALVSAADQDAGMNGRVVCNLNETLPFRLVEIYRGQYHIVVDSALDREKRDFYALTVTCHDLGTPRMTSQSVVGVTVVDQNDNSPEFSREFYTTSVAENTPRGQSLLRAEAVDDDDGLNGQVTYELRDAPDGLLAIDRQLGVIRTAVELDYEKATLVTATVVARDSGVPCRSSSATVVVSVTNVDDERLAFTESVYSFSIAENRPAGTVIGHVTATDADLRPTEQRVRYQLETSRDSRMFYVVEESGAVLSAVNLDFERRHEYRLVVAALQRGKPGFATFCDVVVSVNDVNDHRPQFVYPSPGGEDHVTVDVDGGRRISEMVCTLSARDGDHGDNGRLEFTIVSFDRFSDLINFDLDPITGQLLLTAEHLAVRYVELTLVVQVTDHGLPSLHDTGYLRVIVRSTTSHWEGQQKVNSRSPTLPSRLTTAGAMVISCAIVTLLVVLLTVVACCQTSQDKSACSSAGPREAV